MPAGRCGIALRTTFIPVTSRDAAIAYKVLAGDYAVLTCASPARIFALRPSVAIVDFATFEPAAYKYNNNNIVTFHILFLRDITLKIILS